MLRMTTSRWEPGQTLYLFSDGGRLVGTAVVADDGTATLPSLPNIKVTGIEHVKGDAP